MALVYTFEKIAKARKRELVSEITAQLSQAEQAGGNDKPHHLARAQLLLQELANRTMLKYTRWIAALTGGIVGMTVVMLYFDWTR